MVNLCKKVPTGTPSWMVTPQQGDDGIESSPDQDELFSDIDDNTDCEENDVSAD